MSFGEKIKGLREEKSLTQKQMSEILEVSKSNISKYEADTVEPSIETIRRYAAFFRVSTDYLLNDSMDIKKEYRKAYPMDIAYLDNSFAKRFQLATDGYDEAEISDLLDISLKAVAGLLCGDVDPAPDLLEKSAQVFKISTDYLLGIASKSRDPDGKGIFPFQMDVESIHRLQEVLGTPWNISDAEFEATELGITYDEFYNLYHYGFLPHTSVLTKICLAHNVSSDYILNISDSKLRIEGEEDILVKIRSLDDLHQQKVLGIISEEILQQERDNYMKYYSNSRNEGSSIKGA